MGIFKNVLHLYKRYKKWVILFSFLTIFNGLLSIIIPLGIKFIVDSFLGIPTPWPINTIFTIFIIIVIVRAVCWYFYRLISDIIGSGIELDLRLKVYGHLQKLPNEFFKNKQSGDITSTVINDIASVKNISQLLPEELLWILVIFFGVMTTSFFISKSMFYVMLIVFLVNAFFIWLTSRDIKKVFAKIKAQRSKVNQQVLNVFHGINDSKAFNNEVYDYKRFSRVSVKYRHSWKHAIKKIGVHDMVSSLSMYVSLFVILVVGFNFTRSGELTISEFILFSMYTSYLIDPIYRTANFVKVWKESASAMERIEEIKKAPPQRDQGKSKLLGLKKGIEFQDVSLWLGKNKILNNISFFIQTQKTTALVGHSGGGKTTIINAILRFIDQYDGIIKVDGKSVKDYKIKSLRQQIGLIQQNPYIFPGTLYQNVKYGRTTASEKEVIQAIKEAQLGDFVKKNKRGIYTLVGENGVKLSGGQKQRVAIARVILKNPQIIILDEATSALDTSTEQKIQKSLANLMHNRTSIVIAHRLNTIINADKILVIKNGSIVGKGKHKDLLKNCNYYGELQGI